MVLCCDSCDKDFRSKYVLVVHEGQKIVCSLCQMKFTTATARRLHKNTQHMKKDKNYKSYKCDSCGKSYSWSHVLKRHVKDSHQYSTNYDCGLCEKNYTTKRARDKHIFDKHDHNKIYKCNVCEQSLSSQKSLTSHIYGVHEGKNYKNKSGDGGTFINPDRLKKHINTLHDDQKDFRDDHSEIVNANNGNKLNNFQPTSEDHNPITESENLLHHENEVIHKNTTSIVKSERQTIR